MQKLLYLCRQIKTSALFMDFSNWKAKASDAVQSIGDSAKEFSEELAHKTELAKQRREQQRARAAEIASGLYEEDGKLIISTVDGMQAWLQSLQEGATPSALQVLQNQLRILQHVQSPTLTGMAIDNMIACLHQALTLATSDTEKENIRAAFALMIQNYMFFTEATLRLACDSNQQEAKQLLVQAGDMLSETVYQTASLAVPSTKKLSIASVVVKNIFAIGDMQDSYIKRLVSWYGNKKQIAEKQQQYLITIEQLFDVFDHYDKLIGPSIQVKGMLSRYRKQLVDNRKDQRLKIIYKRATSIDKTTLEQLATGVQNLFTRKGLNYKAVGTMLGAFVGMVGNSVANRKDLDIDTFCMLEDTLANEQQQLLQKKAEMQIEQQEMQTAFKEIKFFQFNLKKEAEQKINDKMWEIYEINAQIEDVNDQLQEMRNFFPDAHAVAEDLKNYNSQLLSVEQKYDVAL